MSCASEKYINTHLSVMVLESLLSLELLIARTMFPIERYHLYSCFRRPFISTTTLEKSWQMFAKFERQ